MPKDQEVFVVEATNTEVWLAVCYSRKDAEYFIAHKAPKHLGQLRITAVFIFRRPSHA